MIDEDWKSCIFDYHVENDRRVIFLALSNAYIFCFDLFDMLMIDEDWKLSCILAYHVKADRKIIFSF